MEASPSWDPDTNAFAVWVTLDTRGSQILSELSSRIAGDQRFRIAVFFDGHFLTAPFVTAPIHDGQFRISGGFSEDQANILAAQLNSGPLPVTLS